MPKSGAIGKIEKEIEQLTPQDQLRLLERLAKNLGKSSLKLRKERDWKALYGLGKGLWAEDAQAYVNRLREDRI